MGHIFGALDQYASAQQECTRRAGYLDIENQNSLVGNCSSDVGSIMRGQIRPYTDRDLDPYAAGQIGWRDSDGDNIFDPMDTPLSVTMGNLSQDGNIVTVEGAGEIGPYPAPSRASVTINQLIDVRYRIDGGLWLSGQAADGAFDGLNELYRFTTEPLAPGRHTMEVVAVDSAGNLSEPAMAGTINVLDPVDGALISELNPISAELMAGQGAVIIEGLAYQLENKAIVRVEYRLDAGDWRSAMPQDGAFDSAEENFSLNLNLAAGTYLVEVRAIDAAGQVETDYAARQFTIHENTGPVEVMYQIFLPTVIR
jgi:hypothetical protein